MILRKLNRTNSEELKKAGCTYLKMLSAGTFNNKQFVLYEPTTESDPQAGVPIDNLTFDSSRALYVCI